MAICFLCVVFVDCFPRFIVFAGTTDKKEVLCTRVSEFWSSLTAEMFMDIIFFIIIF